MVDANDLSRLSQYRWYRNKRGYVVRNEQINGRWRTVGMHQLVLVPRRGYMIDHADGNPLNNRRSNLRYATASQSNANRALPLPASGFRGVSATRNGRWLARIRVQKRLRRLGVYHDPLHAALAYNVAAIRYFGQFARLNPITIPFEIRLQVA